MKYIQHCVTRSLSAVLAATALSLMLGACGDDEPTKAEKRAKAKERKEKREAAQAQQAPAPKPAPQQAPAPQAAAKPPATQPFSTEWRQRFNAADTNKDGGLSRQELQRTKDFAGIEKYFDLMDTNKDGKVTLAERQAWADRNATRR